MGSRALTPDVSSSYLKSEAQTWVARSGGSGRPTKKVKRVRESDGAEEEVEAPADDALATASRRLIVHLGADSLRVGRASDVYPTVVPCALARKMSTAAPAPSSEPPDLDASLEALRAELRAIMRQYKLRPVSNGWQSANSYNESVKPERVLDHNDVYDVAFVRDVPDGHVLVGQEALLLAELSPPRDDALPTQWQLFRPCARGLLDVARYAAAYGEAAVEALLGDLQHILTYALSASPDHEARSKSPGLGITPAEFSQYSVLLLVPDAFSRSDLRALGHLLLRYMGFAALNVQTEGLCAMFGAGLSSACIVDLGATSIGVSCVEEGLVLPETRIALTYGGRDVSRFFGHVFSHTSFPYRTCDPERRLADATLLDQLKERLITLSPSQVNLNLFDFSVHLPGEPTYKYALRVYDEPIVAALMLFHPYVLPRRVATRRALTEAAPADTAPADEPDMSVALAAANASLGGDEACELSASSVCDVAPTLAMFASVRSQLPPAAAAAIDPRAPAAAADALTDTPEPANGSQLARPSPVPTDKNRPAAAPAVPQTSAFAAQAARCSSAAALAAQSGLDVVGAAGDTPLDRAVFCSLLASTNTVDGQLGGNEERLRRLANNIVCIGGSARISGLAEALEARVSMLLAEHYAPADPARAPAVPVPANFSAPQAVVIPPPRNLDPASLAWKGLAVLSHLDSMQELWVQAADWDTFGYRALKEKSLFL